MVLGTNFFRVAGLSSKESRVGGYARLMTVRKTTLLLSYLRLFPFFRTPCCGLAMCFKCKT